MSFDLSSTAHIIISFLCALLLVDTAKVSEEDECKIIKIPDECNKFYEK